MKWNMNYWTLDGFGPTGQIFWPVWPKHREHVKSITYKALARLDATAKYSHSGEMLSWGLWVGLVAPTLFRVGSWVNGWCRRSFACRLIQGFGAGIRPPRLNEVRYSETMAKSKKVDTNLFVLNLDKFSRIWGEGGVRCIFL